MPPAPDRILVILGPTAVGKSDLAVALGRRFGGEVLGADSMQVYRRLDAGTAKPTAAQRAAVPHHLIDLVEPTDSFSVAQWLQAAEAVIGRLHGRGSLPIIVGGTNLYLKALLEGLFEGPSADPAFREGLRGRPGHELHERLQRLDPAAARRIHPNDRKRIVRALEVHHAEGRPISQLQKEWAEWPDRPAGRPPPIRYRHDPVLIGLRWETGAINRRINARVKAMFHPPAGVEDLVSETRRLEEAGLLGPQARQALGTRQVLAHLEGRCTLEDAMERVKIDTRRFAKSQRSWLKRYHAVRWLDAGRCDPDALAKAAAAIAAEQLSRPSDRTGR